VPPSHEQSRFVEVISNSVSPLASAADRAKREIDLILEYRTRLIADVVTGKHDVRHIAPAESPADVGIDGTFADNEEEQEGYEDALVEEGTDAEN
jgi:type I restriction enzyme S subunit